MEKVEGSTEFGETSDLTRAKAWNGWEEQVKPLEKLRDEYEYGHKIEISKEEILNNHRRQEDELLALEAIYQDNLQIFDKQDGLLIFQISLHYAVPEGFKVSVKLHSGTGTINKNDADLARDENSDEGFFYSFGVKFLPPIVLTCMLPKSYPSHQPPYFTIDTQWLNELKCSSICTMLDTIWSAQLGQEVIFQWTEWLQNSSLSFLGFGEELDLTVRDLEVASTSDRRAISITNLPDRIIPFMILYNEERCHEAFLNSMQKCDICLSEHLGSQFVKLPCEHLFCLNCLETYSRIHVKEGSLIKLPCPSMNCGAHLPPILLKRLLDHEEYERWESLLLQRTLNTMSDVVYCPRCDTACLEDSEANDAQCSKCFFSFCTLCKKGRHVGKKCEDTNTPLLILQKERAERLQSGRIATKEQQRREKELMNEVLSMKEVSRIAKQCPGCKIAIYRTEGCNKMTCANCHQLFCYNCNKLIDGFDHFSGGCELFPSERTKRWEKQMQSNGPGFHLCPRCGQGNAKVANYNLISCRSCITKYCALCRKVITRRSNHFSRNGCKTHTADP